MQKQLFTYLLVLLAFIAQAQKPAEVPGAKPATKSEDKNPSFKRELSLEAKTENKGEVTIKGQKVPYKVTASTQPVWDEEGKAIAGLFYVYYERTDVTNKETRPLVISFNGGPGTASVWMHLGYTGPKKLKIDDEGYPVQPYGIEDNPQSIIDVADIVFVDPVNTGFSRILDKSVPGSKFFGVNADVKYLADWINAFVARKPDENHEEVYRRILQQNPRLSGIAFALDRLGDIYLVGRVPTSGLTAELVDALMGSVAVAADGMFDRILATGFESSIRKEWQWRQAQGEPTDNLEPFLHLLHLEAEEGPDQA